MVAAVAVGAAVVALAPVALPAAIILAGAAAGAVGFGLNEALNQEEFCLSCILKEAARGALVGAVSALPSALFPATAGVAALVVEGAISSGLDYTANVLTGPDEWNWGEFAFAVGLGGVTAGAGRFSGPRANPRAGITTKGRGSTARAAERTWTPPATEKHHTIPREVQKKLPPEVRSHPDVMGRRGLPNRKEIPYKKHRDIHKGPGGGRYNQRFDEEIARQGGYENVGPRDVTNIRDKLVKEFEL